MRPGSLDFLDALGLASEQAEMQKNLHDNQPVQAGGYVVHHDSGTFRQAL